MAGTKEASNVPEPSDPDRPDVEEANNRLNDGLKICRAVLTGYRALLTGSSANDNLDPGRPVEPAETASSANDPEA